MAGAIAAFKPAVKIPAALARLFSRAIEARQLFSDWYEQHNNQDEYQSSSNRRHSHFTNVLNNTWEILRPFVQAEKSRRRPQPGQPSQSDASSVHLTNRFSGLHVEVSPENEQDTAAETDEKPDEKLDESDYVLKNVVPVAIAKSEEEIEDDFLFAIHSFFLDLHDLRTMLSKGYWQCFCTQEGGHDLILTALVTNTAIQLVRRAEQQLDLLIERPKKYLLPAHAFPAIMMHATHQIIGMKSINEFIKPSRTCHFSLYDEHADLLFWNIYQAVQNALWRAKPSGKGTFQVSKVDDDPSTPETARRIFNLLPCFQAVSKNMSGPFASDEVTLAVGHIFETRTTPIWTLFALQVLLDAQDVVRHVGDAAFQTVQRVTRQISKTFASLDLKACEYNIDPKNMQLMRDVIRMYELDVLEDNFRKSGILDYIRRITYKGKVLPIKSIDDIPPDYDMPDFMKEPDFYLRNNPIKCGILEYGLCIQAHNFGYRLEDGWRGILAMTHLYAACTLLYPDDPVWPDMEYFLHYQDVNAIFSGGLPGSMDEATKKALLSFGVAPSNFARNKREVKARGLSGIKRGSLLHLKNTDIKLDKGRPVTNPCLLDKIFSSWTAAGAYISDDRVLELLNALSDPKVLAEKARQRDVDVEKLKLLNVAPEDADNPGALIHSLLARLTFVVKSEMGNLMFSWASFAKTCRGLWDRIIATTDALYGPGPRQISDALMVILDEARQLQWLAEELNSPDGPEFVRANAGGLPGSWAIIQEMNKTAAEPPVNKDNSLFGEKKMWVGDQEITRVLVSTTFAHCRYPTFGRLKFRLYEGWKEGEINESLFLDMQCWREALWRKMDERLLAEAQEEAEEAAGEPSPDAE
ncbi:hypothetical protein F4777DRAFT_535287 [Nemania sp. FL0916]|nr:hypothetical protein F4777DRAFT_535287 [Nemania sp. FL0916]